MYTFLECYLPPISFDIKPEMDLRELNELFELNLSSVDKNRLGKLRTLIDVYNLRSYLTADRLSLGGSIESDEISYCLEQELGYPPFVFDYLEKYKDINERIHHFRELLLAVYDWLLENTTGFLFDFIEYDRKLWITTMAYLSKKRDRDLKEDLDFLDPHDPLTTLLLAQHESEHFEFPEGLEGIDLELDVAFKDPLKEMEMVSRLRFNFCQTYLQTAPFTLDSIFAYYTMVWVLSDFYESQDQILTKKGGGPPPQTDSGDQMMTQSPVWQLATGTVEAVNGNLVSILFDGPAISGEKIYVEVEGIEIKGEIIEIASRIAKAQMFEDTKGIRLGSKVTFSGELIEAELGPGLLNLVVDGIGSPLADVAEKAGYFMERGIEIPTLDRKRNWEFTPTAKIGDQVTRGVELGFVIEGRVRHKIMVPFKLQGVYTIAWLAKTGHFTVETPIAKLTDQNGQEISVNMLQKWPIKNRLIAGHPRSKDRLLETGMRAIDTMFPILMGSTTCSPGPFGAGKTVIQHLISKYANVDIVIIVACGERAGEVVEVITEFPHLLDPRYHEPLMNRTTIICNTSSMPVAARESSIYMGITIAEYYRQMGLNVLLLADSTSRWAQAMREVSARLEEIPGEEAFPAYLTSRIHSFYERAGVIETPNHKLGSISIIGAVSPAGGNFDEPVTQATLMVVDTFLCLSRGLSDQRRYPAISRDLSWSSNVDIAADFLRKQAPDWKYSVDTARKILLEGLEIEKRMDVVGEDAIQMSDYVTYLKKELFDFSYLQQNAFDQEDVYCPLERQIEIMKIFDEIFASPFLFKNHDSARKSFMGLQNDLKNLNYTAFRSDSYLEGKARIEKRIEEMLDVCK